MSNHQYNFIKRHVGRLEYNIKTVTDQKVIAAVRYSTTLKVIEQVPLATDIQKANFETIPTLNRAEEFHAFLSGLEDDLIEFPQVTDKQIKKMFSKNKKLKIPDLAAFDYRFMTYLGWIDISSNKLFIVYNLDGNIVGVECRYTLTHKKGVCSLCNKHEEVALVTAQTKSKSGSADHFKRVGNYMCIDSLKCNQNITDVTYLEKFIHDVIG